MRHLRGPFSLECASPTAGVGSVAEEAWTGSTMTYSIAPSVTPPHINIGVRQSTCRQCLYTVEPLYKGHSEQETPL